MGGWNYFHYLGMFPIGLVEVQHIENNVLYVKHLVRNKHIIRFYLIPKHNMGIL